MYFQDLSDYCYVDREERDEQFPSLNIGWLARSHEYRTGAAEEQLLDELLISSRFSENTMRGVHDCEFCDIESPLRVATNVEPGFVDMGTGEIRIEGQTGIMYAAPTLISHYVDAHQYLPPREFIEAVDYHRRLRLSWGPPTREVELARLQDEGNPDERTGRLVSVTITAEEPRIVIDRVQQILKLIVPLTWSEIRHEIYQLDQLSRRIPEWFIDACASDPNSADDLGKQPWWRKGTSPGHISCHELERWTIPAWLSAMMADERQWRWWDSKVISFHEAILIISTPGWPIPLGGFVWLLGAAGALSVDIGN